MSSQTARSMDCRSEIRSGDPHATASPILAVIGPSGAGKSALVRELHRRQIVHVHPTWTTRPPRPDERAGVIEHRFVTESEFDALRAAGLFVDTVSMFGLAFRYGLPRIEPVADSRPTVVMVRAPLVDRLRAQATVWRTYQVEAGQQVIGLRLRARGSSHCDITARSTQNRFETVAGRRIADRTFMNEGTVEQLADSVEAALAVDQGRTS